MRGRRRAKRIIAGFALFAALASASAVAAIAPHGGALAAVPFGVAAHATLSARAALAALAPAHHRESAPQPRRSAVRLARSFGTDAATALTGLAASPATWLVPTLPLGALVVAAAWMLAFVGRSSRTRGQPRVDALAL